MRIILADDQRDVRLGLRVLLEQQPGFEIVAETTCSNEILEAVKKTQPDIILLDWELPDLNIVSMFSDIKSEQPEIKIIALSGCPDARKIAFMSGADAYVCKCDQPERLIEAIEEVCIKGGEKNAIY